MAGLSIFPKISENGRFPHLANCWPLVTFAFPFRKAKCILNPQRRRLSLSPCNQETMGYSNSKAFLLPSFNETWIREVAQRFMKRIGLRHFPGNFAWLYVTFWYHGGKFSQEISFCTLLPSQFGLFRAHFPRRGRIYRIFQGNTLFSTLHRLLLLSRS